MKETCFDKILNGTNVIKYANLLISPQTRLSEHKINKIDIQYFTYPLEIVLTPC